MAFTLDSYALGGSKLQADRNKREAALQAEASKRRRVWFEPQLLWRVPEELGVHSPPSFAIDLMGDNKTVIDWANGQALILNEEFRVRVALTVRTLHVALQQRRLLLRCKGATWFRHVLREGNTTADNLANKAMDRRSDFLDCHAPRLQRQLQDWGPAACLWGAFDGGRHEDESCGAGCAIWARRPSADSWCLLVEAGRFLPPASVASCELAGLEMLVSLVGQLSASCPLAWPRLRLDPTMPATLSVPGVPDFVHRAA